MSTLTRTPWLTTAVYIYRAGNQATIGNITAEKAVKDGFVLLGMFAAEMGVLGSYENGSRGFTIGRDLFTWAGAEYACFSLKGTFIAANNGTDGTFVAKSGTDEDGAGVVINSGRGSIIEIASEGNDGRSCILGSHDLGGPVNYTLRYLEGNGGGPRIDYRPANIGMVVKEAFMYPSQGGAGPAEDIYIVARNASGTATANEGPTDESEWLILQNLHSENHELGFAVDSNTYKYKVRDCAGAISYPVERPVPEGQFASAWFKADATLSDTRTLRGLEVNDEFEGDGATTAFVLTGTPTTETNPSSYPLTRVWVANVLQTYTTDYTISGGTITFVSAPALDARIRVVYPGLTLSRAGAGIYRFDFIAALPDFQYTIDCIAVQSTGTAMVFSGAITANHCDFRTVDPATPGTLADLGVFLLVTLQRVGT